VHYRDILVRQLHTWVKARQDRIVPFLDLAEIDVGKNRPGKPDLTRLDSGEVDHGNIADDYRRKLHQPALLQLFRLERHVRGAEIDGLVLDLPDAAAGTDRLVVEVVARFCLIGFGPLGVNRIRKCGASARNIDGER